MKLIILARHSAVFTILLGIMVDFDKNGHSFYSTKITFEAARFQYLLGELSTAVRFVTGCYREVGTSDFTDTEFIIHCHLPVFVIITM